MLIWRSTARWQVTMHEGDDKSMASNASICEVIDADCSHRAIWQFIVFVLIEWLHELRCRREEISAMDSIACTRSTSLSLQNTTVMDDSPASHVILDHIYCSPSRRDNQQAAIHLTREAASTHIGFPMFCNKCVHVLLSFRTAMITKCLELEHRQRRSMAHSQWQRQIVEHRCRRLVIVSVFTVKLKCFFSIPDRWLPHRNFNRSTKSSVFTVFSTAITKHKTLTNESFFSKSFGIFSSLMLFICVPWKLVVVTFFD